MSISVSPQLPAFSPQLAHVEPSAGIASLAENSSATTALDFLLITSRVEFENSHKRFTEECSQAGVHADILFIEDLPGQNSGEKLASLHRMNAGWHTNGIVVASTIKVALLHGSVGVGPTDASVDRFRQECMGVEASQRRSGQNDSATASAHMITAAGGKLVFPTDLFDAALRATVMHDGKLSTGFVDTIIYGACGSGVFRDAAKKTGGSYVFGSGKKSVFTEDFNSSLSALVKDQGQRKRQGSAPLSARDCWNLMRDLSGEHVSLVGNDYIEINKVLLSGHTEPRIEVRSDATGQPVHQEISAQAIRALFAKIHHGSAASVERLIDRWGPRILSSDHRTVMPDVSLGFVALASEREAEQKIRLLLSHAPGYLLHKDMALKWLNGAIEHTWIPLLGELFKRMADTAPLPLSLEEVVIWLRSNPVQTDKLMKLCRGSRDLSESVGAYLAKAQLEESGHGRPSIFSLPAFFDRLAKKAASRAPKIAAQ